MTRQRKRIVFFDDSFVKNRDFPYIRRRKLYVRDYRNRPPYVNQIDKVIWCGTVIRNKKLIGRWIWSRNRFQNPVLISTIKKVNGKPKRFTKLPICEAIKKIVLAEIKRQKEEGNANKTTS